MRDEEKSKEQLLTELKELRRQAQEELSRSSALFSRVMETSPAGIVVLDRNGNILTANLQATRVLGLARDQITSLTYNDPQWRITDYEGNPLTDGQLPPGHGPPASRFMTSNMPLSGPMGSGFC